MWNALGRAIVCGAWLLVSILGSPAARAEYMNLQEFGQADGLGNLALNALQQDSQGFLWIGTDNGLCRYDGARIDRIGTQELRRVSSLSAAGSNLWVVSESGAWLWRDGKLQRVLGRDVRLPADSPMAVATSGDEAWFITTAGLQRVLVDPATGKWSATIAVAPQQLALRPEAARITSVMVGRDGAIWMGCGTAICRWRDGVVMRWDERKGVAPQEWHALLEARDGSIWARSTRATIQLPYRADSFVDRAAPSDRGDLVRAREDSVREQRNARHRLKTLLLRNGVVYAGKSAWTAAHLRWLASLALPHAAQQIAFQEYLHAVSESGARITRLELALRDALEGWSLAPVVAALQALRGVQLIAAVTLVAEIQDFHRFDNPRRLMAYLGLVPSEDSSGQRPPSGGHHQGRQLSGAAHAGGCGTPVSLSGSGQRRHRQAPIRIAQGRDRHRLDGSVAAVRALQAAEGTAHATCRTTRSSWPSRANSPGSCGPSRAR